MEIGDKEYFDNILVVAKEVLNSNTEPTPELNMLAAGFWRLYDQVFPNKNIQKEK